VDYGALFLKKSRCRMKQLKDWISSDKFDVRVVWTGPGVEPAPPDASLVEGWPLDPPDSNRGWMLVDFGIHENNYFTLWAKPKARAKKRARKVVKLLNDPIGAGAADRPKKKRGRTKKTPAAATPANGESGDAPGVDSVRTEHELQAFCEHTQKMLVDTINFGEKRDITREDLAAYMPLCHQCQKLHSVLETASEASDG
jgi:hypothetical protein